MEEHYDTWKWHSVREWQLWSMKIHKTYYQLFGGRQFDRYSYPKDENKLLGKICFANYGAPTIAPSDINSKMNDLWIAGYTDEQVTKAREIYKLICDAHGDSKLPPGTLLVGIIFVICKLDTNRFAMPIFSVCTGNNPESVDASRVYIDMTRRSYSSWSDWESNNTLPKLKYAYPRWGFYTCATSTKRYEYDPMKLPNIEFANSPQCKLRANLLRTADVVSGLAALGCGAIGIIAMFTPLAPAVVAGAAYVGTSTAVYSTGRALNRVIDKGCHGEDMADLESITLYIGLLAAPLSFASSAVTAQLLRGAAEEGRIFSQSFRVFATVLNCCTISASGAMMVCGLVNLMEKLKHVKNVDEIPALDLLQFSMSIFFFCHTVIRPITAKQIIKNAQDGRIQQYADALTDADAKAVFDKFVETNRGSGSIKEQTKIVRMINDIPDGDAVFSKFSLDSDLRTGGHKFSELKADGQRTTYDPRRMPLRTGEMASRGNPGPINLEETIRRKLRINSEDVRLADGEAIFDNLQDWQQRKVNATLNSISDKHAKPVIDTALRLTESIPDNIGQGTGPNARLNKMLSLSEILNADVTHRDKSLYPTANDFINQVANGSEYRNNLIADIKTANRIAENSNLRFNDPLKAVYHFRKHGTEFPLHTWNPSAQPLEVYLTDAPKKLTSNARLAEVQQLNNGGIREYYIDRNDQYSVVVKRGDTSTICSMFKKGGEFSRYMSKYEASSKHPTQPHPPIDLIPAIDYIKANFVDLTPFSVQQNFAIFVTLENGRRVDWNELRRDLLDTLPKEEEIKIPTQKSYKNCPVIDNIGDYDDDKRWTAIAENSSERKALGVGLEALKCSGGDSSASYNLSMLSAGAGLCAENTEDVAKVSAKVDLSIVKAEGSVALVEDTVGVYGGVDVNVNTGASIGTDGVEVNFLGWGISLGKKTGINTPLGRLGTMFGKSSK